MCDGARIVSPRISERGRLAQATHTTLCRLCAKISPQLELTASVAWSACVHQACTVHMLCPKCDGFALVVARCRSPHVRGSGWYNTWLRYIRDAVADASRIGFQFYFLHFFERPLYSELTYMFSFFFYSERVIREYSPVTRIHTAPTEYLYYSTIIKNTQLESCRRL